VDGEIFKLSFLIFFMKKRGALQISFSWLFAIIVGAFILFLAIYAAVKFINVGDTEQSVRTGKEIGILLTPFATSVESAKTSTLTMPIESRIYAKCEEDNIFGKQILQVSQKSFNKWVETDLDVVFYNKYLFTENPAEGKNFYIFSKPFAFPFKVADLIYLSPAEKKYCFSNAPEEIKEELESLNQKNLLTKDCPDESIKVCFESNSNCEIIVNYNLGYLNKKEKRVYFETNALMYAAIFSSPDIYECQLKRLMQRTNQLALLYRDKANFVSRTGCTSNLNLLELSSLTNNLESSANLAYIKNLVDKIKEDNYIADCRIY